MRNIRTLLMIGCLVCLYAFQTPNANAGQWDQKTTITFSQPVELPNIMLPAGTYVFRLLDYTADTNIVEVRSADEQKVYAVIRTIPDYRVNAKEKTSIVFGERYAGSPQIIKEWFFPDMHYGHEFVYPKTQIAALAKAAEQPNVNKPAESAKAQPQPIEEPAVVAEQPRQETQPVETQSAEQPQQEAKAEEQEQTPPESATAMELPKTASLLPLTGLIGMLLLCGAFGLRLFSKTD